MYSARSDRSVPSEEKERLGKPYFEIHEKSKYEGEFDALLSWTNGVMNMYDQGMNILREKIYRDKNPRFNQAWEYWTRRKPILIYPYLKAAELNASYSRVDHKKFGGVLRFHSYPNNLKKIVHTSHNKDIVFHETGHAMLDIILPGIYDESRLQTQALHESFGDLTCLFCLLSEEDCRVKFLEETQEKLSVTSFLTLIGEPLNEGTQYGEIRNLKNDKKMGQTDCDAHDLSNVFSAAIYELLVKLFNDLRESYPDQESHDILNHAQVSLRILILRSLIEVPYSNPSFSDVGNQMKKIAEGIKIFDDIDFGKKIQETFSSRGINIEKPHTKDDDTCPINFHQPAQSFIHRFCRTFPN